MADQTAKTTRTLDPASLEGEFDFDRSLRPTVFDDFVGQDKIKSNLRVFVEAARGRREALDHVLLYGPPGLGKTTLAHIVANAMGTKIRVTSGPALEKAGDLAGLLTNLGDGDILFIDEIHRLNHVVEEYLYPAMEDFKLDIIIDKGANARSIQLQLPKFTLIGATTRAGLLTAPMRARFGVVARLDYYLPEQLSLIVKRSAQLLNVEVLPEATMELARRARGTPRIANRLLRRVRDFAQLDGNKAITRDFAGAALNRLEVDELGLDEMDKRILATIIDKFSGGPVGLNTIAVAVGEEGETLEEIYEPFLIQQGLLQRTARGRMATALAYKHLGLTPKTPLTAVQKNLF